MSAATNGVVYINHLAYGDLNAIGQSAGTSPEPFPQSGTNVWNQFTSIAPTGPPAAVTAAVNQGPTLANGALPYHTQYISMRLLLNTPADAAPSRWVPETPTAASPAYVPGTEGAFSLTQLIPPNFSPGGGYMVALADAAGTPLPYDGQTWFVDESTLTTTGVTTPMVNPGQVVFPAGTPAGITGPLTIKFYRYTGTTAASGGGGGGGGITVVANAPQGAAGSIYGQLTGSTLQLNQIAAGVGIAISQPSAVTDPITVKFSGSYAGPLTLNTTGSSPTQIGYGAGGATTVAGASLSLNAASVITVAAPTVGVTGTTTITGTTAINGATAINGTTSITGGLLVNNSSGGQSIVLGQSGGGPVSIVGASISLTSALTLTATVSGATTLNLAGLTVNASGTAAVTAAVLNATSTGAMTVNAAGLTTTTSGSTALNATGGFSIVTPASAGISATTLNLTGNTSINVTGNKATTIGNSSGVFQISAGALVQNIVTAITAAPTSGVLVGAPSATGVVDLSCSVDGASPSTGGGYPVFVSRTGAQLQFVNLVGSSTVTLTPSASGGAGVGVTDTITFSGTKIWSWLSATGEAVSVLAPDPAGAPVASQTNPVLYFGNSLATRVTNAASKFLLFDSGTAALRACNATGAGAENGKRGSGSVGFGTMPVANTDNSAVAGGNGNGVYYQKMSTADSTTSTCCFIGAGAGNAINDKTNTTTNFPVNNGAIVGGSGNSIFAVTADASASFIGGGSGNSIRNGVAAVVAGGNGNSVTAAYAAVVGGNTNSVAVAYATIVGGQLNNIYADAAAGTSAASIGGGNNNWINGNGVTPSPVVSGPVTITVSGTTATSSAFSTVAGGQLNTIARWGPLTTSTTPGPVLATVCPGNGSLNAAIGGGASNAIGNGCDYSFIGGGQGNFVTQSRYPYNTGAYSGAYLSAAPVVGGTVSGGSGNSILAGSTCAAIGGGTGNTIGNDGYAAGSAPYSFIGGGSGNTIDTVGLSSAGCVIGGGLGNYAAGVGHVIAGGGEAGGAGHRNQISAGAYSVVGGGKNNVLYFDASYSAVLSGSDHTVGNAAYGAALTQYSLIAGGYHNTIDPGANSVGRLGTTVVGGLGNYASGSGHVVVGGGSDTLANAAAGVNRNQISSGSFSVIVGGSNNVMYYNCSYSNDLGGFSNTLGNLSYSGSSVTYSLVGSGAYNKIDPGSNGVTVLGAVIVGGLGNYASGSGHVIVGGGSDTLANAASAINRNQIASGKFSVIVGGSNNVMNLDCSYSSGLGGLSNTLGNAAYSGSSVIHSLLIGGSYNKIDPGANGVTILGTTVVGGLGNYASGSGHVIVGGGSDTLINAAAGVRRNQISTGSFSVIVGGGGNAMYADCSYSIAVGGLNNVLGNATYGDSFTKHSVIVGGAGNTIDPGAAATTLLGSIIVGGFGNYLSGGTSVIVGGGCTSASTINSTDRNQIVGGTYGFIGGGRSVQLTTTNFSVACGGQLITVGNSNYSFVGGGLSCSLSNAIGCAIVCGQFQSLSSNSSATNCIIGGGRNNSIFLKNTIDGATISGGLSNSISGSVLSNNTSDYSTISGGQLNTISSVNINSSWSTVTGGYSNNLEGSYCVISGGDSNTINANMDRSAILGGGRNTINTSGGLSGGYCVIAGGRANLISGTYNAIVGGGTLSQALGNSITKSQFSAILGGETNSISNSNRSIIIGGGQANAPTSNRIIIPSGFTAGEANSIIGGGAITNNGYTFNTITAGQNNTILGGASNSISDISGTTNNIVVNNTILGGSGNSIVDGNNNTVIGVGCVNIGSASGYSNFIAGWGADCVGAHETIVMGRGSGGVNTGAFVWGDSSSTTNIGTSGDHTFTARAFNGYYFYLNGGRYTLTNASGWQFVSDRDLKENIVDLDTAAIAAKFATMPLYSYTYRAETDAKPVMGPMAQDWIPAFTPWRTDLSIGSRDIEGVLMASTQYAVKECAALREENAALRDRVAALEAAVASILAKLP